MPVYEEKLPPTKSSPHSGIKWTPAESDYSPVCGVLTIQTKRCDCVYLVEEFPTAWRGRGFHLSKIEGEGSDKTQESYDVFASADGPAADSCDCAGSTYRPGEPCKHRAAVRALLENSWL